MSGFDKIEFAPKRNSSSKEAQSPDSFMPKRKRKTSKTPFKFNRKVATILGVIVGLLVLTGIPAFATYQSGMKTYKQAKLVSAALKNQNIELAADEIAKTKKSLEETRKNFRYLIVYKFVPIAGWYYSDAEHLLNASAEGLDGATTVVDAIEPYADVLGLKGQGTFAAGSAEDRIKTAVMTTGKIMPKIDDIAASLTKVQKEVDQIKPWHYPSFIFGKNVNSQITNLRLVTDQSATFINDARPLVKALPSLLGESEEKKYLVLFQNDKELRPTGGFITGYSIFRIDKGVIHPDRNDDIYPLDNTIPNKKKAPAALANYLKVYQFNLRDSNLSPDYVDSMETFRSMYEQSPMAEDVDGIIAIDTNVLVKTIKILDDTITAGGMTFTTENDPRCDCPQVIFELENNISRPVNYVKTDRKSILGDLMNALLVKALSSSPKKYWGPLFQSIVTHSGEKHIMFYLYDKQAQKGIESLNAAGRIKEFDGDYLHINETNFSGAKVNIFMQEQVDNSYDIKSDGTIEKTVTINYKNPFPASDCNLERGNLCLNAEYKDWIRVYVPKGSELINSKGSSVKLQSYDELGKTVFEGLVRVRPQGSATYSLTYKLPFKMEGNTLPVLIQKQPGTNGFEYKNIVNGTTKETFPLKTDKEFELKK